MTIVQSTPETFVWVATDVATATHGCVLSSGWPPALPSARVKTVSGPSSNVICKLIQAVPIESGRHTSPWLPKIARVAYTLVRSEADHRCFPEVAVPSGRTRSARTVDAISTS